MKPKIFENADADKLADMQSILREYGINTMKLDDDFNSHLFIAMEQYHLKQLGKAKNRRMTYKEVQQNKMYSNKEALNNYVEKLKEVYPRRLREDLMKPAELAIHNAAHEVEKLPADVRLTEAVVLLGKAKDLVSDFIDEA